MAPNPPEPAAFAAPTATIASSAVLAAGVRVWDGSHVGAGAVIGSESLVGRGVTVGAGVQIGARCKLQNAALVYGPATLGDGVFVGPGSILTNDNVPRAINPDGSVKTAADWRSSAVIVEQGASIGAGAVCVSPVRIGRWAMVAAGAVVVADVPDHALVAGVPARQIGWVGRTGARLLRVDDETFECPDSGERFVLDGERIEAVL